jgi:hypothetical protein
MFETGERTARILLDVVAKRRPMPAMVLQAADDRSPACTRRRTDRFVPWSRKRGGWRTTAM